MMIEFNINDYVSVRLTRHGRQCLERSYALLNADKAAKARHLPDFTLPKEDAEGWSKWQMHDLMAQLGPHICANIPFETTIRLHPEG